MFPGLFKASIQVDRLADLPLLPAEPGQVRTRAQRETESCPPVHHAGLRRRKKIDPIYRCSNQDGCRYVTRNT